MIQQLISSLPSAQTFSNLSPDSASSTLLSSLSASFDFLCPLSSRPARSSPPAPWLDDSLRAHRTGLRATERKWRKTRLPADLASFHSLLSTFSSSVSAAKATFYHSKFQASASNPRKLFATFSSLLNPPPSLSADDFVNHFEKKVDDIRSLFAKSNDTAGPAHTALPCALTSFSPLSPDEISRLVTAGRPTTCPLDPIPSSLLQTISGDLLPYLTSLINSSLTTGYVPSVFKRARVAPLLKKPTLDPSNVNNYRPVSLLSFLSKTLERAVLGQLSCYLSQNDLLDPNQSGFKTGHSTETALLCVTEALRTAKANSLSSALMLLDLSAAFDTVNHQILLSTLSELGISGAAHAWIASYLTGRSYQVAWRESVSAPRALTTGVPQGSILGPLLFSLYTKSLGSVISSHGLSYHCYADNTQLIFSFPPSDNQVANRISACLADISVWMTDHHLKLNLGKTELLFLPGKDCPFHDLAITVDNSLVSSSQSAKNLGVTLDNTLSFSTNIKAVTRSCRFMLYNIRRVQPCLTQEAA
uniref:Reverse transcriptase domain-containing protein n=1 Tax=Salmo trutta TaxID=8032 RepID=A0A673XCE1_SALTR